MTNEYCTTADVQAVLADKAVAETTAESGTTIDTAILDKIRADASARVNMYLAGRYAVPITAGDNDLAVLRELTLNIVAYKLLKRRLIASKHETSVIDEYKQTLSELRDLRSRDMSLPDAEEQGLGAFGDLDDFAPIAQSETKVYGIEAQLI